MNSASGPDQFPAIPLKECTSELSVPLYMLWHASLKEGTIPALVRTEKIVPVCIGGPRSLPKNNRPIILISYIIKIFEKVISKYIVVFIENNEKMNSGQYGLRGGRSCLSQLLVHHDHILQTLEDGANLDVVHLDFEKAFDKVGHGVLLHKLWNLGIVGHVGRFP